jgi:hypothetical protein
MYFWWRDSSLDLKECYVVTCLYIALRFPMIQLSLDRPLRIYETTAVKQQTFISDITTTEMVCRPLVIQGKTCWPRFEITF